MSAAPREGDPSPWGRIDYTVRLAEGITLVSTPGHGGVHLSPERQAALPEWARSIPSGFCPKPVWWEEDCEVAVPLLVFYDDIAATDRVALKERSIYEVAASQYRRTEVAL